MKTIVTKQINGQSEKIFAQYQDSIDVVKLEMVNWLIEECPDYLRKEDDGSIHDLHRTEGDTEIYSAEETKDGLTRYSYDNFTIRCYTEEQAIEKFGEDAVAQYIETHSINILP